MQYLLARTKTTLNRVVSIGMTVGALASAACSGGNDAKQQQSAEEQQASGAALSSYDGATLLRGIFFDNGPAANVVDGLSRPQTDAETLEALRLAAAELELQGMPNTASSLSDLASTILSTPVTQTTVSDTQRAAAISAIVQQINSLYPTFLDGFGEDVTSSDPATETRAVLRASQVLVQVMSSELTGGSSLNGDVTTKNTGGSGSSGGSGGSKGKGKGDVNPNDRTQPQKVISLLRADDPDALGVNQNGAPILNAPGGLLGLKLLRVNGL